MDALTTLRELGSQTIHATTHIPFVHVEKILKNELSDFQKPQLFGFLSILEREYKIDLSALRQEYLFDITEAKAAKEPSFDIAESSTKMYEKQKEIFSNKKVIVGVVAVVVVAILIFIVSTIDFSYKEEEKIEINNTAIDKAKKNLNIMPTVIEDVESFAENNDVESAEFGQEAEVEKASPIKVIENSTEPMMPLYLRIVPKGRLWLGIINTETHRRRVETISKPLTLDAEKSWLIVTGYGHLDMECGDTTNKYREDRKLLILYEAGVCQIIDKEEFKARNRGKLW